MVFIADVIRGFFGDSPIMLNRQRISAHTMASLS
jgi:hypothetical protein